MKKIIILSLIGVFIFFCSLSVAHAFDLSNDNKKIPPILSSLDKGSFMILNDTVLSNIRGQANYQMVNLPLIDTTITIFGVKETVWPGYWRYGNWGGPGYSNDALNHSWVDAMDLCFKFHDEKYGQALDIKAKNEWLWADMILDADIALLQNLYSLGKNGSYISKDPTASKLVVSIKNTSRTIPDIEISTLSELARCQAILAFLVKVSVWDTFIVNKIGNVKMDRQRLNAFYSLYKTAILDALCTIKIIPGFAIDKVKIDLTKLLQ